MVAVSHDDEWACVLTEVADSSNICVYALTSFGRPMSAFPNLKSLSGASPTSLTLTVLLVQYTSLSLGSPNLTVSQGVYAFKPVALKIVSIPYLAKKVFKISMTRMIDHQRLSRTGRPLSVTRTSRFHRTP
jgi:hypothetical protein